MLGQMFWVVCHTIHCREPSWKIPVGTHTQALEAPVGLTTHFRTSLGPRYRECWGIGVEILEYQNIWSIVLEYLNAGLLQYWHVGVLGAGTAEYLEY